MFPSLVLLIIFSTLFVAAIEVGFLNVFAQQKLISVPFITKIIYYDENGGIIKYEIYKQIINGTDKKDFFDNFRKQFKKYEPENETEQAKKGAVFINAINMSAALVPAEKLTNETYVEFVNETVFAGGIYNEEAKGEWTISERCFFTGIGWSCQKGLPVHYLESSP